MSKGFEAPPRAKRAFGSSYGDPALNLQPVYTGADALFGQAVQQASGKRDATTRIRALAQVCGLLKDMPREDVLQHALGHVAWCVQTRWGVLDEDRARAWVAQVLAVLAERVPRAVGVK